MVKLLSKTNGQRLHDITKDHILYDRNKLHYFTCSSYR